MSELANRASPARRTPPLTQLLIVPINSNLLPLMQPEPSLQQQPLQYYWSPFLSPNSSSSVYTSLSSLWNEDDGTECSSDSSDDTDGNPKPPLHVWLVHLLKFWSSMPSSTRPPPADPTLNINSKFKNMHDTIHVDEKLFYIKKNIRQRYFLVKGESVPVRKTISKCHIPKLMFFFAVARPRYDYTTKKWFDGKLGIWALFETTEAKKKEQTCWYSSYLPSKCDSEGLQSYDIEESVACYQKEMTWKKTPTNLHSGR